MAFSFFEQLHKAIIDQLKRVTSLSHKKTVSGITTAANKQYASIASEGKFGGKRAYGRNRIQAETACTTEVLLNSIFSAINLLLLHQHFLCPNYSALEQQVI